MPVNVEGSEDSVAGWDYIVVGSGSSGSVVANRLSGSGGGRVLVLEAGGDPRDIRFRIPLTGISMRDHPKASWRFESEPEPGLGGRTLAVPRGRMLGGSSAINGAVYNRGNPTDFDQWAEQGLPGWDYASVLPYFRRVENHWKGDTLHHGADGEVAVRRPQTVNPFTARAFEAARAMGYSVTDDVAGRDPEGWHVSDFNVDDRGRRVTSAAAFLKPVMDRDTLEVRTGAQVLRIVVEAGRAVGIEYLHLGQRKVAKAEREVVLCSGAIGSPHLLMLSGIGRGEDLAKHGIEAVHHLPGVGANFNDQPAAFFEAKTKEPLAFERFFRADRFIWQTLRWSLGLRNELSSMPVIAAANTRTTQGRRGPDMRFMISALTMRNGPWFPGIRKGAGHMMMAMYACAHPRSRGSITLRSGNPLAPPRILYNLLSDPWDVEEMRRGHKLLREYLAEPALHSVVGDVVMPGTRLGSDAEIDAYNRDYSATTAHPLGSCRMGTDELAVVDGECRVRGLDGLRVIDLSVLPVQISGNPNGTAIMLGDRVSDMMLGRSALAPVTGY